jgi:hypothetical protein
MIIELFIFFQVIVIILFFMAFFTKQPLIWVLTIIFSGIVMFACYNVEYSVNYFNVDTNNYEIATISRDFGYLMSVNMIFFGLGIVMFFFDMFDQIGLGLVSIKKFKSYFKKGV